MSIKLPRVGIPQDKHQKYIYYTTSKNIKEGEAFRFETMADMFIMATIMGFYLNNFKPLSTDDKPERPIKWDVFMRNEEHMQIIKSICLLHIQKDPKKASILQDNEEMAYIIEGYANGGIVHLLHSLEEGDDLEGNMIAMIKEYS